MIISLDGGNERERGPTYVMASFVSHIPQASVAGHVLASGFVLASQPLSLPVEHVTAPGVPEPAAVPHASTHPLAGAAVHVAEPGSGVLREAIALCDHLRLLPWSLFASHR